jgi:hypothetical protein
MNGVDAVQRWLMGQRRSDDFPYRDVVASVWEHGKHFVPRQMLEVLGQAREATNSVAGPEAGGRLLRSFLNVLLDKADGRSRPVPDASCRRCVRRARPVARPSARPPRPPWGKPLRRIRRSTGGDAPSGAMPVCPGTGTASVVLPAQGDPAGGSVIRPQRRAAAAGRAGRRAGRAVP